MHKCPLHVVKSWLLPLCTSLWILSSFSCCSDILWPQHLCEVLWAVILWITDIVWTLSPCSSCLKTRPCYEPWAAAGLKMVLSSEAAHMKGHRCKSWTLCVFDWAPLKAGRGFRPVHRCGSTWEHLACACRWMIGLDLTLRKTKEEKMWMAVSLRCVEWDLMNGCVIR